MPFASLSAAVAAIQTGMSQVSGVASAPASPTEQAPNFPFVTTYPKGLDSSKIGPDPKFTSWWDIYVEFHVARLDLPADISQALANYPETLVNKMHSIIQSNHNAFEEITGSFGTLQWGAVQTLGFQFIIHKVKIQTTIS